jgi:metal-sulfur cluster biosynthetic enzyme
MSAAFDADEVRAALASVIDPEAGLNIVDLGLVYGIEIDDGATGGDDRADPDEGGSAGAGRSVRIALTMTSAACPMADLIVDDIHRVLGAALGVPVRVELVWDPPWTPERMSDLAREHFGWTAR